MPLYPRRPYVSVGLLALFSKLNSHILALIHDTLDVYDSSCKIRFIPYNFYYY